MFHFKGYWVTRLDNQYPCDYSFGSSSYNSRSFDKDNEIQYYISTQDE